MLVPPMFPKPAYTGTGTLKQGFSNFTSLTTLLVKCNQI